MLGSGSERSTVPISGEEIDGSRLERIDRNVRNRKHRQSVGERGPGDSVIARTPHAAVRRADVDDRRVNWVEGDGVDAPGVGAPPIVSRPNQIPFCGDAGGSRHRALQRELRRTLRSIMVKPGQRAYIEPVTGGITARGGKVLPPHVWAETATSARPFPAEILLVRFRDLGKFRREGQRGLLRYKSAGKQCEHRGNTNDVPVHDNTCAVQRRGLSAPRSTLGSTPLYSKISAGPV